MSSCQTLAHMPSGRHLDHNLRWTRSQAAAVAMRDCSAIVRDTALGARPSVRVVNSRQLRMRSKSASIQSPVFTWFVAMRFESGCTMSRSMARFR